MPKSNANSAPLHCHRCGSPLDALTLPLSRLDTCPSCNVELHVCRMCRHFAPAKPDACDEDEAPEVRNKTVANFCDWFEPDPDAWDGRENRLDVRARAQLDALFGDGDAPAAEPTETTEASLAEAEKLFRK
jgi:hypothetical protein